MGWLLLLQITKKEITVCKPYRQSLTFMRYNEINETDQSKKATPFEVAFHGYILGALITISTSSSAQHQLTGLLTLDGTQFNLY